MELSGYYSQTTTIYILILEHLILERPIAFMDDSLLALLDRYQEALDEALKSLEHRTDEHSKDAPDPPRSFADILLELLYRRDEIHQALREHGATRQSSQHLERLVKLDDRFRANANAISDRLDFAAYRRLLPDSTENWWWHLEDYRQPHRFDRLDWLFQSLTLLCWPFNFALLIDIGQRFLSGGVGVGGVIAVLAPTLLTLLQANTELTQTGREAFDRFIDRLGIPSQWREEAKFGSTFLLLVGLGILWSYLPEFGVRYNQEALEAYESGDIASAEKHFKQAIALDPDNVKAHYNLGDLYETRQDMQQAREHYQIAAQFQLPQAYNNLARLDIQDQNYEAAVVRLQEALKLVDNPNLADHSNLANNPKATDEIRYSLLKNLGWARFKQDRLDEAQDYLTSAITLSNQMSPNDRPYIRNPGSAACLLAQVLDQQDQPTAAIVYWQQCSEQASSSDPNEDRWIYQAKQKLAEAKPTLKPTSKRSP